MAKKGKRRGDALVPLHRPKRVLSHVADEYEELGNVRVAAELRRHQRGHARRFVTVASYDNRPAPQAS